MEKINKTLKEWKSLQPLKNEDKKRLDDKFKLEFNYNSNHIEGNTLTYGQTKLLLMFGETTGDASLKDYQEMKAHNVGLEMIKQYALEKERPLTESFIRELNQTILVENYWKEATTQDGQPTRMEIKVGEYKSRPNSVITATGETFEYATPEQTPALMADLVSWFNKEVEKGELNPIELATVLHYRYIRIHPFEDGNGRIARLLVNYVMLKYDYPMVIIKTEDKPNYLRILHQCDVESGFSPFEGANATLEQTGAFVDYMKVQLEYALDICIRAAKGESIDEDGDWKKKLELSRQDLKEAPYFSKSLGKEVLKNSVFPLFRKIDNGFKEYESMFSEKKFVLNNVYTDFDSIFEIANNDNYDYNKGLRLSSLYIVRSQFTKETKMFNPNIFCIFQDKGYSIQVVVNGKNEIINKKYTKFITEEETNLILNFVGNHLAEFISSKIAVEE